MNTTWSFQPDKRQVLRMCRQMTKDLSDNEYKIPWLSKAGQTRLVCSSLTWCHWMSLVQMCVVSLRLVYLCPNDWATLARLLRISPPFSANREAANRKVSAHSTPSHIGTSDQRSGPNGDAENKLGYSFIKSILFLHLQASSFYTTDLNWIVKVFFVPYISFQSKQYIAVNWTA